MVNYSKLKTLKIFSHLKTGAQLAFDLRLICRVYERLKIDVISGVPARSAKNLVTTWVGFQNPALVIDEQYHVNDVLIEFPITQL